MALKTKQCKHGKFTFYDNDRYIGRQLDVLGYYSENEVQTLLDFVTADSVVVDVGANIGALTVPLAKKAKKVYAFEPQPAIFDLLCANVRANRLRSVVAAVKVAVGAEKGVVEVPRYDMDKPDMNTGAVCVRPIMPGVDEIPDDAIVIPMGKLDDLVPGSDDVDLIKIDVEGMELDVLKGAIDIITTQEPILYVENNAPGTAESAELIEYIMDYCDYGLSWHLPVLECLTSATHRTLTLSSNMLCVPRSEWGALLIGADFWPINSPEDNWHTIPAYAEAIARCGN